MIYCLGDDRPLTIGVNVPATRYFIRLYDRSDDRLLLIRTVASADEPACMVEARAYAERVAGAVAFSVTGDEDGRQTVVELGRYGEMPNHVA